MEKEVCRLCLSENQLSPIFIDQNDSDKYTHILLLTTGIKIQLNDNLPQNICKDCIALVNSALKLRNQSYIAEKELLKRKNNNKIKTEAEQNEFHLPFENINDISNVSCHLDIDNSEAKAQKVVVPIKETSGNKTKIKYKREVYLSLVDGEVNSNNPVTCKICKTTVKNWSCFLGHAKLHLGFKYVCEFCGKSFISAYKLKRHARLHHGMKKDIACTQCDFLAVDKAQLESHRLSHSIARSFVCDTCGATYRSRKCLVQHIESHSASADIPCPACHQRFKSRRHLARHKYNVHSSQARQCPRCEGVYSRKYIRAHVKTHHCKPNQKSLISNVYSN